MTVLMWSIKSTLIGYVRGMPDGVISVSDGASEDASAFRYPAASDSTHDDLHFDGAVMMHGHGGMMRLTFAAPWISRDAVGWVLSIADPDDPDVRLPFATVAELVPDGDELRGSGIALTEQGADLFFGPYRAGTPLDDLVVEN